MSASYDREQAIPVPSDAAMTAQAVSRAIDTIRFEITDRRAFEAFRRAQVIVHLLDEAESRPRLQADLMKLSSFFSKADGVERQLAQAQRPSTGEEWETLNEANRLLKALCARDKSPANTYVAGHINEFIAADPARWERFEQRDPALVSRYRAKPPVVKQ